MPMGTYGAFIEVSGRAIRPQTKKELKMMVERDPGKVLIEDNGLHHGWTIRVVDIQEGESYSTIVGPDPFRSRKWYATVERKGGKLRVT